MQSDKKGTKKGINWEVWETKKRREIRSKKQCFRKYEVETLYTPVTFFSFLVADVRKIKKKEKKNKPKA